MRYVAILLFVVMAGLLLYPSIMKVGRMMSAYITEKEKRK